MPAIDFPGPHILATKSGGFYAVENIRATSDWYIAESSTMEGKLEVSFQWDDIADILVVDHTHQLGLMAQSNAIAAGVLRLEKLIEEFSVAHPASAKKLEIAIFGAVSLALTILPNSTTMDLDLTANTTFIRFLDGRRNETTLELDILNPQFLMYLGNWRERAARVLGYQGTSFWMLHPLDTLVQKLQRLDPKKFRTKDEPDIRDIMRVFRPSEATLISLLTENPGRFRMADETEDAAMKRNTAWFLQTFVPTWTFEKLWDHAKARRTQDRQAAGLEPLPQSSQTYDLRQDLPMRSTGPRHEP